MSEGPLAIVDEFPSKSRPGVVYHICVGKDEVLYCTCPCWARGVYQGKRNGRLPSAQRNCRHLEEYRRRTGCTL